MSGRARRGGKSSGDKDDGDDVAMSSNDSLRELRDSLLSLQRHITKQEGDILEMKKQILLRVTRPEVEMALNLKVSPADLNAKVEEAANDLNKAIATKLTRKMLTPLLGRKATKEDLAELAQEMQQLKNSVMNQDWMRIPPVPAVESSYGGAIGDVDMDVDVTSLDKISSQMPTDMLDFEGLQERVEQIEIAIEVVRGRTSKPSGSKGLASKVHKQLSDLTATIQTTRDVCADLQRRYEELTSQKPIINLRDQIQAIQKARTDVERVDTELQMFATRSTESKQAYDKIIPQIEEIHRVMEAAVQHMNEQKKTKDRLLDQRDKSVDDVVTEMENVKEDVSRLRIELRDRTRGLEEVSDQLDQENADIERKMQIWKDDLERSISDLNIKSTKNSQNLYNLREPLMKEVTNLKAENRLFFQEMLRVQGKYEHLMEELNKMLQKQGVVIGESGLNPMIPHHQQPPQSARRFSSKQQLEVGSLVIQRQNLEHLISPREVRQNRLQAIKKKSA